MRFNLRFFLLTILILFIEILIATVFKDWVFVRAYLGDVIVVILIYTFVLSFFQIKNKTKLIIGIFAFSVFIEILQYFKTAEFLGFKKGEIAYIVLGNSFAWEDILCYAVGCFFIWICIKIGNK